MKLYFNDDMYAEFDSVDQAIEFIKKYKEVKTEPVINIPYGEPIITHREPFWNWPNEFITTSTSESTTK